MKKLSKVALMAALITGTLLNTSAYAAEDVQEFSLDAMVVTATRYEKKDVDTPASVQVISSQKLEEFGATSLYEAMQYAAGMTIQQYGPGGLSMGNMASKVTIRGTSNGTLVLINGIPANIRGTYDLNDIPVENVERVEIVRGGGSVLYGSEATGGVINIITKKTRSNSIKAAIGNRGQQQYSGSMQAGNLAFGYKYSKTGDNNDLAVNSSGKTTKNWKGPENNNFDLAYKFNDRLTLSASHNESRYHYLNPTATTKAYDTFKKSDKNNIQLTYKDENGLKADAYYLDRKLDTKATTLAGALNSKDDEKSKNYGVNIQKVWELKSDKFLLGGEYHKDNYRPAAGEKNQSLNNYSIYTQYDKKLSDKDGLILAARETWTTASPSGKNLDNFSGQLQYVHKVTDNQSLYGSVGQSFKIPALHQNYKKSNNGSSPENLKPQKGLHYELGWKKAIDENRNLRVALFAANVKDNITAKPVNTPSQFTYENENIKNYGLEAEYAVTAEKGFGYSLMASISNPKTETIDTNKKSSGYNKDGGQFQLVAGLNYKLNKFTSNLNASYLSGRETFNWTGTNVQNTEAKPYLLTNLNMKYKPEKNISIFANFNNILDRKDIVYYSYSSTYYTTGFSFLAGVEYNF